jgi:hypothetical protein
MQNLLAVPFPESSILNSFPLIGDQFNTLHLKQLEHKTQRNSRKPTKRITSIPVLYPTPPPTPQTYNEGEYGYVWIGAHSKRNRIIKLNTELLVPTLPNQQQGTIFIWPGLEPNTGKPGKVGLGVLQPVLTFGPSCVSQPPLLPYESWWITGMYVNVGSNQRFQGCHNGDSMQVDEGEWLKINMYVHNKVWTQNITSSKKSISYSINLNGQGQIWAIFAIELYNGGNPIIPIHFRNTQVGFFTTSPQDCFLYSSAKNNQVSPILPFSNGNGCDISSIILSPPKVLTCTEEEQLCNGICIGKYQCCNLTCSSPWNCCLSVDNNQAYCTLQSC